MGLEQATAAFVQEAHDILGELEDLFLGLEEDASAARIDAIFRSLHTLKGSGAMFGYTALARFAHHFENAYEQVRAGSLPVGRDLADLSLEARDRLSAFLDLGGDGEAAEALLEAPETRAVVTRIQALVGATDATGGPGLPETGRRAGRSERPERFRLRFRPAPDALRNGMRPDLLMSELAELADPGDFHLSLDATRLPTLDALDPTLAHLDWHVVLRTEAGRAAVEDVFIFADDAELEIEALPDAQGEQAPAGDVPRAPSAAAPETVPDIAAPPSGPAASGVQPARTGSLRIAASRLDDMMDALGELVIAQARLDAVADQIDDATLGAVVEEVGRLVYGLRDATLSIRMLPVEQVFGKFRRVVRDLSAELGKEVRLVTTGGETEMDKNVLDRIGDPLVHMIRNALDHGIEPAGARVASGKPATGTLSLSARQEGGEILIKIEDDGRGLDADAIRARAVERGLLAPEAEPSEAELHALIFAPGFSTAKALSPVSGRGVGMDAVRSTIDQLGGGVEVDSRPGRGTRVTLRLPMTLAIVDGLRVRLGETIYVLPLSAVDECVEMPADAIGRRSGRSLLQIRDEMVPFRELGALFGLPRSAEPRRRVVIVRVDGARVGLVVDDILGQSQTVIKSLSPFHRAIPGLGGATILGDGRVALIVDVSTLVRSVSAPGPGTDRKAA